MTDLDYAILDPGIRGAVQYLRERGFDTTDSGDGVSKPPYDRVFDVAHVAVATTFIERAASVPVQASPHLSPSERARSRRETPEAERLLRAGYEIALSHAVAGVREDAATAELDAAIATATEMVR